MAIIDATAVSSFEAPAGRAIRVTTGSVAASSTSDEIRITAFENAVLKELDVSCSSTDFDISLRTSAGASANSSDEKLKVTSENLHYYETDLNITLVTRGTPYIYLVITNNDAVNATGTITIDLVLQTN